MMSPVKNSCNKAHMVPLGGNRFKAVRCTREKGHVGTHSNGKVVWPR